ncbi:hypothetical protein B0J17DRAFT_655501 [Rhizoctonia solani]|nr:hypothetical protein B0J17DRAFT_655501 [Rhizoctonia solani]
MRIPSISVAFALAAGLVSAAPIRVVIISSSQRVAPVDAAPAWAQSIRWGHAAAPAFNPLPPVNKPADESMIAHWMSGNTWTSVKESGRNMAMRKGGCRGGMRAKTIQIGNKLRIILGLTPIEPHTHGMMRKIQVTEATSQPIRHRYHVHHHTHKEPFVARLSHALAALGPWEGRIVSFVLGCGLGAILRMLFVFGVLFVRSVRCQRQQPIALEEDTVIFVADIKEPVVVETLPAYAEKTDEVPQGPNAAN